MNMYYVYENLNFTKLLYLQDLTHVIVQYSISHTADPVLHPGVEINLHRN